MLGDRAVPFVAIEVRAETQGMQPDIERVLHAGEDRICSDHADTIVDSAIGPIVGRQIGPRVRGFHIRLQGAKSPEIGLGDVSGRKLTS